MAQHLFNDSTPNWSVKKSDYSSSKNNSSDNKLPKENEQPNVVLLPGQQANPAKESLLLMGGVGIMGG